MVVRQVGLAAAGGPRQEQAPALLAGSDRIVLVAGPGRWPVELGQLARVLAAAAADGAALGDGPHQQLALGAGPSSVFRVATGVFRPE